MQKKLEGKYVEAKRILDRTLALITGSSEYNNPEVQQLATDVGVVKEAVKGKDVSYCTQREYVVRRILRL